jgi:hypothetical protein
MAPWWNTDDASPPKGHERLNPSVEDYRRELKLLSQRLRGLKEGFRAYALTSKVDQAMLERVQQENDQLEAKLSDVERADQWKRLKSEFGSAWNSFVIDLNMLRLRLMDIE